MPNIPVATCTKLLLRANKFGISSVIDRIIKSSNGARLLVMLLGTMLSAASAQERICRLPPVESAKLWPPDDAAVDTNYTASFAMTRLPTVMISAQIPDSVPHESGWWEPQLQQQQFAQALPTTIHADELVLRALTFSDDVQVVRLGTRIQQEGTIKAAADFDPLAFFETRWDDVNDPVGNTLTTGGPRRFNDHHWQSKAGLRQRTATGGSLELNQRIGLQDTNSVFFSPSDQAATRMTLSFTQPLLNRGGTQYNQSVILLAEIETTRVGHELTASLQEHAFTVVRAYWDLYLQRALYVQRQRSQQQAELILNELQLREELDALRSQIARARAAVAVRRAAVQRAEVGTRNAQARIVALTNDPQWGNNQVLELMPAEFPVTSPAQTEMQSAFQTALMHRPELAVITQRIREAQVRLDMSKNELLPTLNLVVDSYVAGLDGDYRVANSFGNQFNDGAPSYGAGVIFQVPWGNRKAKAEYRQRDYELAQIVHELRAVLTRVALDVQVAINEVVATYAEMQGRYEALIATNEEVKYLHDRWHMLPGEDRAASFVLEELLDAQDRQMDAEATFVNSQVEYTVSHYALQKALGTLLHMKPLETAPQTTAPFEPIPSQAAAEQPIARAEPAAPAMPSNQ